MVMETDEIAKRIFELLDYNPEDGSFTWKINRRGRRQKGMKAGCLNTNGYIRISIDYKLYNASRIAWLFIKNKWPDKYIDHIDGNPSNNRANNLREASILQNGANRKKPISNKSGIKGVSLIKSTGKWGAWIKVSGKSKYLGSFATKEQAGKAYEISAKKFFGDFHRN